MKKKYLVDIPHPHFVHFFKNIIRELGKENVIITCQESGIITELLDNYGFNYIVIGEKYESIVLKAYGQVRYLSKYLKLIKEQQIGFLLGMSPAVAFAAKLTGRKMLFFDDDDSAVQPITKKITIPLADYVITPACLKFENYGKKHFTYMGFQELAYLSPNYFTPDITVISKYGLVPDSYFVLRFNDFHAHHDIGHSGMPDKAKDELINLLEPYGKVYITSEGKLHQKFEPYQLRVNPVDIHHVLAFARMHIGDSQTMTSEAAVLGTPAIRCNTFKGKIAYLNELEEVYQLTFAFLPTEADLMFEKVESMLNLENLKQTWNLKKEKMLSEMVDVNKFVLQLIQNEVG